MLLHADWAKCQEKTQATHSSELLRLQCPGKPTPHISMGVALADITTINRSVTQNSYTVYVGVVYGDNVLLLLHDTSK